MHSESSCLQQIIKYTIISHYFFFIFRILSTLLRTESGCVAWLGLVRMVVWSYEVDACSWAISLLTGSCFPLSAFPYLAGLIVRPQKPIRLLGRGLYCTASSHLTFLALQYSRVTGLWLCHRPPVMKWKNRTSETMVSSSYIYSWKSRIHCLELLSSGFNFVRFVPSANIPLFLRR